MAQFRGVVQGQRGEVSRLGGKSSGLTVKANGWDCGIEVRASYDTESGEDRFTVWVTGGSNKSVSEVELGTYGRAWLREQLGVKAAA